LSIADIIDVATLLYSIREYIDHYIDVIC
jgi:hypothetical protein